MHLPARGLPPPTPPRGQPPMLSRPMYDAAAAACGPAEPVQAPPPNGAALPRPELPSQPRLSPAQRALNRISPSNEPLTGESGFFEQRFFIGFWHNIPPVVPPPPGQQETQRLVQPLQDLGRFKPPEACRYGNQCRFKLSCSRYHGEQALHAHNCACEDESCLLGHPLRAGRDRTPPQLQGPSLTPLTGGPANSMAGGVGGGLTHPQQPTRTQLRKQPPPGYQCAKCKETDHYLNQCPMNTCFKCYGRGHIASNCPNRTSITGPCGNGSPYSDVSQQHVEYQTFGVIGPDVRMDLKRPLEGA